MVVIIIIMLRGWEREMRKCLREEKKVWLRERKTKWRWEEDENNEGKNERERKREIMMMRKMGTWVTSRVQKVKGKSWTEKKS